MADKPTKKEPPVASVAPLVRSGRNQNRVANVPPPTERASRQRTREADIGENRVRRVREPPRQRGNSRPHLEPPSNENTRQYRNAPPSYDSQTSSSFSNESDNGSDYTPSDDCSCDFECSNSNCSCDNLNESSSEDDCDCCDCCQDNNYRL